MPPPPSLVQDEKLPVSVEFMRYRRVMRPLPVWMFPALNWLIAPPTSVEPLLQMTQLFMYMSPWFSAAAPPPALLIERFSESDEPTITRKPRL